MAAIAYTGPDTRVMSQSALAIDELTLGTLDSTKIERVAATIRAGKHANPVLGAIAAYLYRQLSGFDNLRRMAYYYVAHGQPIPFDIALLGQMDVSAKADSYLAKVPVLLAVRPCRDDEVHIMAMYAKVRRMRLRDGLTISKIARRTSLSRNTLKTRLRTPVRSVMNYRRSPPPRRSARARRFFERRWRRTTAGPPRPPDDAKALR
jgi:hypothetical protein